jgi:hypothetical protein
VYEDGLQKRFNESMRNFEVQMAKWGKKEKEMFLTSVVRMRLGSSLDVERDGCEFHINSQIQFVGTEAPRTIQPVTPLYGRLLEERCRSQLEQFRNLHVESIFTKSPREHPHAVKGYAAQSYFLEQMRAKEAANLEGRVIQRKEAGEVFEPARKKGSGKWGTEQELVKTPEARWRGEGLSFEEVTGHKVPPKTHQGWKRLTVWMLVSTNYPNVDFAIWFPDALLLLVIQATVQKPEGHRRSLFLTMDNRGINQSEVWRRAAAEAMQKASDKINIQFAYLVGRAPGLVNMADLEGRYVIMYCDLDPTIWPLAHRLRVDATPTSSPNSSPVK